MLIQGTLFPKICAVLAVGIGATSREFRSPCAAIRAWTTRRMEWKNRDEKGFGVVL